LGKRLVKSALGDVFAIPLPDGDQAIGQVVALVPELGAIGCALFSLKTPSQGPIPSLGSPVSVLLVTPDLLQRRYWPVLDKRAVNVSAAHFYWEDYRELLWVGAKIYGSAIVREFMEAFHGLAPWDTMAGPAYFSNLLVKGAAKPKSAYSARG
jgi:hypothetical protein